MKKLFFCIVAGCISMVSQSQTVEAFHQSANAFLLKEDYPNALMVLNNGLQSYPNHPLLNTDLAQYYYLQNDYPKAYSTITTAIATDSANDQSYQIAGNIYKALNKATECETLFTNALIKFPTSGPLYNEMGSLLSDQKKNGAIAYWEKGIEKDPSYPMNYYQAAKYYFADSEFVWTILYGEIFVNMDPRNAKTPEIKNIILQSYKKLLINLSADKIANESNPFLKKYYTIFYHHREPAMLGVTTAALTMIRTRFALEWQQNTADSLSFRLFDFHQKLLQEGLFEAYNQWMFGAAENLVSFQAWAQNHATAYENFVKYHKTFLFKMPLGQYYHP